MCASLGWKPACAMKVNCWWDPSSGTIRPTILSVERFEYEHICWDPKDGELCLSRVKPGETLVEARSDSDVQIDRQTWV